MAVLRPAVEEAGKLLGVDVAALAAAADELGADPAEPRIGWYDASDRVIAAAAWPDGDAAVLRRIGAAENRVQRVTAPALRARRGAGWVAYESVPRRLGVIATAVGLEGPCDPAAELRALVGVSLLTEQAPARLAAIWPRLGVACDLVVDRAQPPLGPNLWSFSGEIDAGAPAPVVEEVGGALGILPGHRTLADAVAEAGGRARIGLDAVFDDVHPVIWIGAALSLDAARSLAALALGDAARAGKGVDALAAAGGLDAELAIRLATEDPPRIRITCSLDRRGN